MGQLKAVLFDMDGVLVSSESEILQAAMQALAEFGIQAKPEDFEEFVGAGEDKYVGGTAQKLGYPYDLKMKERTYEIYGKLIQGRAIAYPGVLDVLHTLKTKGYKIAVCSSADLTKVKYNLDSMGIGLEFFDYVVTGDMVEHKKPFPDIYLAAAKYLDIQPEQCLVVEDAINGIMAAKAANMHHVAVTTSFSREKLIDEVQPEYIIDDIRELKVLLTTQVITSFGIENESFC